MQFQRTRKLLNENSYEKITNIKVLIVGIGGVGGYTLESLVRFGIKNITIIDKDTIDISNLNRQIITNHNNIGNSKVKEAILRAKSINPTISIRSHEIFLNSDNLDVLETDYNYIVDACDTITTKIALIKYAINNNIKIISCTGTGNRFDPTKLKITTIWQTNYDPLAKIMRKLLKEEGINQNITVVSSTEPPIKISERTPGSTSLVPSVAGIYCAAYIINDIKNNLEIF